jgi:hypothetical protein
MAVSHRGNRRLGGLDIASPLVSSFHKALGTQINSPTRVIAHMTLGRI